MSNPTTSTRLISIQSSPTGMLVVPPHSFEPFPLPQFPVSQTLWLDQMTRLFARSRQRCMCISLMLDAGWTKWTRPQIPTQRCSPDGVCWSHDDADYADRGQSIFLGGSYQSATARGLDEAAALVPQLDGIHLINVQDKDPRMYAFAYFEGRVHAVDASQFFIDDVAFSLEQSLPHLTLV